MVELMLDGIWFLMKVLVFNIIFWNFALLACLQAEKTIINDLSQLFNKGNKHEPE